MAKLMLVEDDIRLADLTAEFLTAHGHEVSIEHQGDRAVDRILGERPDLVILDVMLPGEDGMSICRRVRGDYSGVILMLTARGEEFDQVLGLELGADDYVSKPVSPRVLAARVKALLRRRPPRAEESNIVEAGSLRVDRAARSVTIDGESLEMTSAEFDLLWALASKPGKPVSREALLKDLRGIDWDGVDRSIDVRVSQVRRKLAADPRHAGRIKTVRGVGYQFIPA